MKGITFLLLAAAAGCATVGETFPAKEVKVSGDVHTLGFYTGTLEAARGAYDKSFEAAARDVCKGDYVVLEKSQRPSTLADTPGLLNEPSRFYWVVRCGKRHASE